VSWLAFVVAFVAGPLAATSAAPAAAPSGAGCTVERVAVRIAADDPKTYGVQTWFCAPAGARTAFVTVSGSTYHHGYWDFPYEPERYSFVRAATAAGFAVLNFDRIGVGESDHPPAEAVDVDAHALVVHQLVERLRTGGFAGRRFDRVVTAGHSQGSAIVTHAAATYHDVDGVVLTGLLRTPVGPSTGRFGAALYPAGMDPAFAGRGLPPGYTTTRPGTRAEIFYVEANTDPEVIATDERTKDVLAWAEGSSAPTARESVDIDVPVLSVLGDHDGFFCYTPCTDPAVLVEAEDRFWAPETCFELFLLPDVGHNDNLHRNAGDWYRRAFAWTAERVGDPEAAPPSRPCRP
jgi:pimeloyl-ACP methyl ester carboxylesterase